MGLPSLAASSCSVYRSRFALINWYDAGFVAGIVAQLDIETFCFFQDAVDAAQVQRRSS